MKKLRESEGDIGWAIRMPNKMYYGYTWTKDINDAAIFNTEQEARNEFRRINDGSKPFKLVKVDLSGWNGYEVLEEKPLKESKRVREGLFDDVEFGAELSTSPMEKYKDIISISVDEGILNRETPKQNIENTIYEVLRMFPEDNINGEILRDYVCKKVYERNPYEEEADYYLGNSKKVVRESVSKRLRKDVYDRLVDYLSEMGDSDYPFHKSIFKKAFDQWIDENADKFEKICQSGDAQDIADELYSIFDEEGINSKCFDF